MPRTMTLMNQTGDITIGWGEDNDTAMRAMVEQKLAEGYTFFLVQGEQQVKLRTITDLGEARQVVMADRDAETLFAAGKVGLVERVGGMINAAADRVIDTIRRAKTVEEIVRGDTVAMRPMRGG